MVTQYTTDPLPMPQPVGGPTARQHRTFSARRADPDMRYIPSDMPVERDRMCACGRYNERLGEGWAAPPGATEGGAAEAAPEAAAEPRESRREVAREASPQPVRSRAHIVRRVWSSSTTSKAAQPARYLVVNVDTVTPSRLPLHLTKSSRVELLYGRSM